MKENEIADTKTSPEQHKLNKFFELVMMLSIDNTSMPEMVNVAKLSLDDPKSFDVTACITATVLCCFRLDNPQTTYHLPEILFHATVSFKAGDVPDHLLPTASRILFNTLFDKSTYNHETQTCSARAEIYDIEIPKSIVESHARLFLPKTPEDRLTIHDNGIIKLSDASEEQQNASRAITALITRNWK